MRDEEAAAMAIVDAKNAAAREAIRLSQLNGTFNPRPSKFSNVPLPRFASLLSPPEEKLPPAPVIPPPPVAVPVPVVVARSPVPASSPEVSQPKVRPSVAVPAPTAPLPLRRVVPSALSSVAAARSPALRPAAPAPTTSPVSPPTAPAAAVTSAPIPTPNTQPEVEAEEPGAGVSP